MNKTERGSKINPVRVKNRFVAASGFRSVNGLGPSLESDERVVGPKSANGAIGKK
jgi:hypothetical protein